MPQAMPQAERSQTFGEAVSGLVSAAERREMVARGGAQRNPGWSAAEPLERTPNSRIGVPEGRQILSPLWGSDADGNISSRGSQSLTPGYHRSPLRGYLVRFVF